MKILTYSRQRFYTLFGDQLTGKQLQSLPKTPYVLYTTATNHSEKLNIGQQCQEGFVFAPSVPAAVRWAIPRVLLERESVWHDLGYLFKGKRENIKLAGLEDKAWFNRDVSRKYLDRDFKYNLQKHEVPRGKIKLAYGVIRALGWLKWIKKFDPGKVIFVKLSDETIAT